MKNVADFIGKGLLKREEYLKRFRDSRDAFFLVKGQINMEIEEARETLISTSEQLQQHDFSDRKPEVNCQKAKAISLQETGVRQKRSVNKQHSNVNRQLSSINRQQSKIKRS